MNDLVSAVLRGWVEICKLINGRDSSFLQLYCDRGELSGRLPGFPAAAPARISAHA